ncbi:MAG: ribosome biogenesis GTPase Der [Candidatus Eremiobacter antarcticus]|nr:ribosome biogenesis GTPase Der [Candidatus Eremiobacteraeota bacterium]MBC5808593.1 ribosome biogenesis GTPase Der [Candidatus Eremiobacteraeota bacterium]PZR61170.1 MAG: ribosome biogenesis GTPase Der [Candidatus Eremiobacter sp. RRmetagenome_bin22]
MKRLQPVTAPIPIVAIVGRPNVGKSALFNRLVGKRIAIVEPTSGVTRDRLYGTAEWSGRSFMLVDTGGIETGVDDDVTALTRAQARIAIEEAQLILFVVDAQTGVMPSDTDVARLLRPRSDKVLLVANKVESPMTAANIYEFCSLGFGVPLEVSSIHGLQSGDLLDAIVARLPSVEPSGEEEEAGHIRLAIVGQPNVGKSSLVNALVGNERAVVASSPGTTRDATDTDVHVKGRQFTIIDTAGIRRHANRGTALEHYSTMRAIAAISRSDVALVAIDVLTGVKAQDKRIAGLAVDEGKGLVLFMNKTDLVNSESFDRQEATAIILKEFAFAPYAAVMFGSALTKKGLHRIWRTVALVADERRKHVSTAKLNQVVRDAFRSRPPAPFRGHALKCYYVTQADVAPPLFVFFVNDPRLIHFSYERYLENALRGAFGFAGAPIRLSFKPRVQQDKTDAETLIAAAAREGTA